MTKRELASHEIGGKLYACIKRMQAEEAAWRAHTAKKSAETKTCPHCGARIDGKENEQ